MDSEIAFVVMAAGLGSRYNGLKQLETFGEKKLTIAEYNILHAIDAGFKKFFFVINESLAALFDKRLRNFLPKTHNFGLIYQRKEADLIKFGNREKPWGTGHAVLCCDKIVNCNFCVTNADDIYGRDAIFQAAKFLQTADKKVPLFANVAYPLEQTLSDNGTVSRGVLESRDGEFIESINEISGISRTSLQNLKFSSTAVASMNLWGFTPAIFKLLRQGWADFKQNVSNLETDEFYLSTLINTAIKHQQCRVKILKTSSKWCGITYKTDKNSIKNFLED